MAQPFLAEIRIFSFNYAPKGWALCGGQTLPINQNQALFSLLGTTYGGNGTQTFALPDFRGRIPVEPGAGFVLGQIGGVESVTLDTNTIPPHSHSVQSGPAAIAAAGTSSTPSGALPAAEALNQTAIYGTTANSFTTFALPNVGNGQPHENRPPLLALNFSIALQGIFPSRN